MTKGDIDGLSIREVRYLLVEKRRAWREKRLEHFHRTGRVILPPNDWNLHDEVERRQYHQQRRIPVKMQRRTWLDSLLFGIEILAIFSIIAVIANGLSTLGTLNRSVSVALQQPTPMPTPIIREVILPDGHTPPTSPGGARPNVSEIPEHLRPVWQAYSNLPTPAPTVEQAIRIQISAIGVDAPVVQGDGWEQLKKGVAQHIGTPNPGERGNIVLSGHNDVFGEVFRYLDRLNPGDTIILFTSQRQYTYIVTGSQMVEPTAVEVMAPTPDTRVTLISCHPYLVDIHRIVVSAVLQG